MKTFQLEGAVRQIAETSADRKRALKQIRKNNEIPAVIYGGEEVVHFTVSVDAVRGLIYTPEIFLVELNLDGKKVNAVLKDIQFQAVNDTIVHMDFLEVFDNKPVIVDVPVVLEGHAEGVKAGGKLTLRMRKLSCKGFYNQIPEKLFVNVETLGLGKSMQVGELSFDNVELTNAKNAVVCAVQLTRAARGAAAAAAAAAAKK